MVTPVDRGLDEPIEVTGTVTATVANPLPVSGSFYQVTQPVSIASMPTTPVTGTFYQATQPVSGTVAVSSLPSIPHDTLTSTDVVSVAKTALTPAAPAAVSVGVTTTVVLSADATRKGCYLTNTSTGYISLGFGANAVLYSGITLNPGGGAFWLDEYNFVTGAINAISSVAASNLGIQAYT